jgi:hypothetical protein
MLVCNHFLAGKSIKQARDRRLCPWYQRVVKQASFHALLANSITHTSSRIYWSLYSFYRAPSTCPDHPRSRLFRLCSRCTETERRCRTTEDVGSRNATPDGELEYIIFLGAWKLCIQTYSLRQREAIRKEMIATRVVPKRSIPAPCTRIHCVSNELLRSQLSSYHGGGA